LKTKRVFSENFVFEPLISKTSKAIKTNLYACVPTEIQSVPKLSKKFLLAFEKFRTHLVKSKGLSKHRLDSQYPQE
jgi:hypothetical protein